MHLSHSPCDDGDVMTENDVLGDDCSCMGTLIELLGCTDAAACNYDKDANTDDGSCLLVGDACDDSNEWTSDDSINDFCECIGEAIYEGCTDIYACNWASEASVDDGSCLYLDALGACGGDCTADEDMDGICDDETIALGN